MADWYIKSDSNDTDAEIVGPMKPNDLLEMVRRGEVVPTTQIRKGDSAWFQAASVGGLFEAAIRPSVTYFCPKCNQKIPKPPTICTKCLSSVQRAKEEIVEHGIHERGTDTASNAGRSVQNWLKSKVRRKE